LAQPATLPETGASLLGAWTLLSGALLAPSGQMPAELHGALFLGELSLDGWVQHVNGILPMTYVAKESGYKSVYAQIRTSV
jgi:predicted ATPase with chaperone activity